MCADSTGAVSPEPAAPRAGRNRCCCCCRSRPRSTSCRPEHDDERREHAPASGLSRAAALGPASLRTLDAIQLATALEPAGELTAFVTYAAGSRPRRETWACRCLFSPESTSSSVADLPRVSAQRAAGCRWAATCAPALTPAARAESKRREHRDRLISAPGQLHRWRLSRSAKPATRCYSRHHCKGAVWRSGCGPG
jgi:hypothetical protein